MMTAYCGTEHGLQKIVAVDRVVKKEDAEGEPVPIGTREATARLECGDTERIVTTEFNLQYHGLAG